jgi:hypothetical protein
MYEEKYDFKKLCKINLICISLLYSLFENQKFWKSSFYR